MNEGRAEKNVYNIEQLCTFEVKERISQSPVLIVPLGGCESFGSFGAVGAESLCVKKVTDALSARFSVLTSATIPFGCSTPFISFAGAAGVKPRTFINMLCEILHGYVFQGICKIFLVNAAPFNINPAAEAIRRLEKKYHQVKCVFFNICDCDINDIKKLNKNVDRDDELILSLVSYLSPDMIKEKKCGLTPSQSKIVNDTEYKNWKKRGRDPQKLAALFPQGTFLAQDAEFCADQGELFFERIVENASARLEALLKT
ncbi:MAG: creatininase family protein [Chitinispirillia bacterium]|nr:creatininase family protein [Chitinispirillia bacterium]